MKIEDKFPELGGLRKMADKGVADAQFWLGVTYCDRSIEHDISREDGVIWVRKAAEQGHVEAQFWLGARYRHLNGYDEIQPSWEEAESWYRKAAEQSHADAMFQLAKNYEERDNLNNFYNLSLKWLHEAADLGHIGAQQELVDIWINKEGRYQDFLRISSDGNYVLLEDTTEAARFYQDLGYEGDARALCVFGQCHLLGFGVGDLFEKTGAKEEAFNLFMEAGEQQDATALYMVSECFDRGIYVKKNSKEARYWYRKAEDCNSMDAQLNIVAHYDVLKGDAKNAARWMRKALTSFKERAAVESLRRKPSWSRQQMAQQMYLLGRLYAVLPRWYSGWGAKLISTFEAEEAKGRGDYWHYQEAAIWYEKAAHEGYVPAQMSMAAAYGDEPLLEENRKKEEVWLRRAALRGSREAQLAVGWSYGERDPEEGLIWLFKALDSTRPHSPEWNDIYDGIRGYVSRSSTAFKYKHAHWCEDRALNGQPWIEMAAKEGHADGQFELGRYYLYGHIRWEKTDPTKALQWFLSAAEQGHARALITLAEHYRDGLHVIQNETVAYVFSNLATMNAGLKERDEFVVVRDELADRLTASKRLEAQEVAARVVGGEKLKDLLPI